MRKKYLTVTMQAILFGSLASVSVASVSAQSNEVEIEQSQNTLNDKLNEETEKITVTGSRIKRDSFSLANPMMTLNREDITDNGISELADILSEEIPSVSAGVNNTNSQSSVQNTGLSTIDLRDLGSDRTLTLIDGRRVVSNSYSGNYISLSTIPSALVDRVEIISGGASAVYGSDAIAGVVNIITQTGKTGFDVNMRGGETSDGGGKEFTIDAGYGAQFDNDKGFVYIATSWDREFGLLVSDRDRSKYEASYDYNTSELCNEMNTIDGDQCMRDINPEDWRERSDNTLGGTFESNDWFYNENNELIEGFVEERDGYNLYSVGNLKTPIDKFTTAVKVDYDLTNDTLFSFQLHYSDNHSVNVKVAEGQDYNDDELAVYADGSSELIIPGSMSPDNPFVPTIIGDSAGSSVSWDRTFAEVGNVINENERRTIRSIASLKGTVFEGDWDWDLTLSYGTFRQQQNRQNEISVVKLAQALDAEYAEDGITIQCADADAMAQGCVPINIFGYSSITDDAADWIRANPFIRTDIRQVDVSGYIAGDLFSMPAGPVSTAFGFEYRRDSQEVRVDEEMRALAVTFNDVPSFRGNTSVVEAFAEATLPFLRDQDFAKRLDMDLSLRLASYSQDNVDLMASYRVGLFYEPVEGYGFRANYARSQRAPSITELISPPRGDYDSFTDICDGATATSSDAGHANCRLIPEIATIIASDGEFVDENSGYSPNAGNNELKEETADTYTIGLVASPIEDLNIAVDFYNIQIKDAITSIGNEDILNECYNSANSFGDDNPFCSLVTRDSEGQITQIIQSEYNLAAEKAKGWDLSIAYSYDLNDLGKIRLKADVNHVITRSSTYQGTEEIVTSLYEGELDSGVFTDRASMSLTWRNNDLRIRWKTKFKGSVVDSHARVEEWEALRAENLALLEAGDSDGVENWETPYYLYYGSYITHDLSVNYDVDIDNFDDMDVYFGVRNLFNNKGPFVPNTGDNYEGGDGNFASAYGGGVGRYIYAGISLEF